MRRARQATSATPTSCGGFEPVSDAGFSDDQFWPNGIRFDFPPQTAHVDAEVLLCVAVRVSPHRLKELAVREGLARVLEHGAEQFPFGLGEMHDGAVARE